MLILGTFSHDPDWVEASVRVPGPNSNACVWRDGGGGEGEGFPVHETK